ncbi:MAG: acetoin utilization protein AcuC [Armatimonadetes bacterium]|nr:acetoin utilization protein AcuC [Armatimonadota bacterium]NIM23893.1 acetoin utilization protein AcuC [Armatimonadota bacterium]NIM66612.1 acetoin utilization protein AcuC [Armatimonadota bacterium]NIM76280.1 acetoin utilization protein AcuC [Armatimonadota bacterium]NIN05974.1 acetoin utilization protein AcuC [Armatimonadota bacterium]
MADALFFWSPQFCGYDLGAAHPLKPERLELTYSLISSYGLFSRPDVKCASAEPVSDDDLGLVHSREYVEVVRALDKGIYPANPYAYGLDTGDNPVFPGIYEASALYSGASVQAAQAVHKGEVEAAFNIAGGLHHAHRARAAGFCVFNDPALAIARLLKESEDAKVVYLDIDGHHGDGVQEAFYDNPRVLTISLHESGQSLFPGTGFVEEIGTGDGKGFSVNLPLAPFTDDETYLWAFNEIVPPLVEAFAPDFLVSQLGVDAHFLDPLTHLCLTTTAYEKIFGEIRRLARKKWIALGGGGYSLDVVPRAWTLAFGCMVGENLADRPPGREGNLRDKESPALNAEEARYVRDFASRSVEQVRGLVFPYHGL